MTNKSTKLLQLGRNIYKFRKIKGLSQNQFAEILDISREHLAKIETAKRCPSITLLFQIAESLGISEQELFYFE